MLLCAASGDEALNGNQSRKRPGGLTMYNVFYIIGVVVVVLAILGYLGFR
jgi:predicted nucleic acid-binding Zn ribbon protein